MTEHKYKIGDRVQVVRSLRARVGEPASGLVVNDQPLDNDRQIQVKMDWLNTDCILWFNRNELRPEKWYHWFLYFLRR